MSGSEKQLIHGFMINGYRGFHSDGPQKIAPLGKMNLFAGANNSGKSNVLLAAHKWIPLCGVGSSTVDLGELDLPQMRDDSQAPPALSFGIAIPMARHELVDLLAGKSNSRHKRVEDIQRFVEVFLRICGADEEEGGKHTLWVEWELAGDTFGAARLQPERLAARLGVHDEQIVNNFGEEHLSRNGNAKAVFTSVISFLRETFTPPKIDVIPAIREIKHNDAGDYQQWELNGLGLPRLIQSWIAPTAAKHRAGRRKYDQLNRFLRIVLADPTAEIGAPFQGDTVHISLGERTLPLSNLGTGLAQITLLAAISTERENQLVCMEEPELHLHPMLLRRLLNYLLEHTSNQYLISTHSAHMLDSPSVTIFHATHDRDTGTQVSLASAAAGRADVARLLGYRPSDLIQANVVIWVEGPSDRIYLNHWIKSESPELVEGIHYSIMLYGGALIKYLTAEDADEQGARQEDFISLMRINRRMIMMIDSDRAEAGEVLHATKARLKEEVERGGGLSWITAGREIENYLPLEVFLKAVQKVHSRSKLDLAPSEDPFEDLAKRVPTELRKIEVAAEVVAAADSSIWNVLDLRERVAKVVEYIYASNV